MKLSRINLFKELNNETYWYKIIEKYLDKDKQIATIDYIENIQQRLDNYKWDYPTRVLIPKVDSNKFREIFMFNTENSYILKVINEIIYRNFNHILNANVFSYKEYTKTSDGAKHIQKALSNTKAYGVKLDISNYFQSVNKETIYKAIDSLIEDEKGKRLIKGIFNLNGFYDNYDNPIPVKEYLGIVPGSALSSFLANYILLDIDNYLESNTIRYARYSDDLIFFVDSKEKAEKILKALIIKLSKKGLSLNPDKIEEFGYRPSVIFLGFNITPQSIDLSARSYNKIKKEIKHTITISKNEKYRSLSKEQQLKQLIYHINKYLYNVSLFNKKHTSILQYAFINVTSVQGLINLDYYIKDRLRQFFTGKNNKSNITKCSNELLDKCGYKPIKYWKDLFKQSKDIFMHEIFIHMCKTNYKYKDTNINTVNTYKDVKNIIPQGDRSFNTFYDFIRKLVNAPIGILTYIADRNHNKYTLDDLQFDYENKVIYVIDENKNKIVLVNKGVSTDNLNLLTYNIINKECKIYKINCGFQNQANEISQESQVSRINQTNLDAQIEQLLYLYGHTYVTEFSIVNYKKLTYRTFNQKYIEKDLTLNEELKRLTFIERLRIMESFLYNIMNIYDEKLNMYKTNNSYYIFKSRHKALPNLVLKV